ncbi:MAG: hypothetical protein P0S96_05505 [Simkaniaceae bacterium]|nr:hypothetical protein [Candidatus Sacchlamyda saccharinae]
MAAAAAATTPAITFETFEEKWIEKVRTVREGSSQEVAFRESFPIAKASIEPLTEAVQAKIAELGDRETCTKDNVEAARGFIELAAVLQGLFEKIQGNKAFFEEHVPTLVSKSDGEARASVIADLVESTPGLASALAERDAKYGALVVQKDLLVTWESEFGGLLTTLTEKIEELKAAIIPGDGGSDSALFDLEVDPTTFFAAKDLLAPIIGGKVPKGSAEDILRAAQALATFAGVLDPLCASHDFFVVAGAEDAAKEE